MVMRALTWAGTIARVLLAGIRLFNGVAGLLAPRWLARQLGTDPDKNPAMIYSFGLFGIRTIIIAAELVWPDQNVRHQAIQVAPIIHASDAVTAWRTVFERQLPERPARMAANISTFNTVLAFIMWLAERQSAAARNR